MAHSEGSSTWGKLFSVDKWIIERKSMSWLEQKTKQKMTRKTMKLVGVDERAGSKDGGNVGM
jgi:hypothetical protein